ncbi:MAG: hypothetical protein M1815_005229 [Lichina confinis]|nr:MAG: hypothetical protein M1815_005229 [Lichina confinis]
MALQSFSSRRTCFQFVSNLHLETKREYTTFSSPAQARYLILAGDIGRLSQQFDKVFLVLRNHEFYGSSREEGLRRAEALEAQFDGKLFVLNRTRHDVDPNISILGCTLQSHIPPEACDVVAQKVKDFRRIDGWSVAAHNAEHARDLALLQDQIRSVRADGDMYRRIMVITHHVPSIREPSRPHEASSPINSAFATDLFPDDGSGGGDGVNLVLKQVDVWIFGHTHYCTRFSKGGVKFASNQRGQPLFERHIPWSWRSLLPSYQQRPGGAQERVFHTDETIRL